MSQANVSPEKPAARWNVLRAEESDARTLATTFKIHPVVARILAARGWSKTREDLNPFLAPMLRSLRDPFELRDMDAAVERTLVAIHNGEKICVYGDYDVDGVTSTALLVDTLRLLKSEPCIVIPHRMRDGYGMNIARVEEIAAAGCRLIITVDTGVSAIDEIRRARELGMDVVVTDHHLAGEQLPEAAALVNPNRPDAPYEPSRLCGVGVAFKFSHALLKRAGIPQDTARQFLMEQLDLVALGTVADVVPLTGENRVFVRHGLPQLLNSKRLGLKALLEVSGYRPRAMTPDFIAFGLAPRLNAAGRTDDAMLALRLLLTRDPQEAHRLATDLDRLNRERRAIEEEILEACRDEADRSRDEDLAHTLVVHGEGWHLGVVGIVAARLTELYDTPAIVLAVDDDHARGSARSVAGFDIHSALCACDKHLVTYGGHACAAGLKIKVKAIRDFRAAINEHARSIFQGLDRTRTVDVDAEVEATDITWAFYNDLQKLQPFGEGNPAPVFLMRGIECAAPPRVVGQNHLKLRLRCRGQHFDCIGFSRAHLREIFEGGPTDILFKPMENHFNGQTKLELELQDARPVH